VPQGNKWKKARNSVLFIASPVGKKRVGLIAHASHDKAVDRSEIEDRERRKAGDLIDTALKRKVDFKASIFGIAKRHEVPLEHLDLHDSESCVAMYVVHPHCRLCKFWDACSLVFLYLNVMIIPFVLAFNVEENNFWLTINILLDIYFIVDIVFAFFRAYEEDGVLVCRPGRIANHYIRGWFWADLLASFPYQWVYLIVEAVQGAKVEGNNAHKYLKLMRLARLLRLVKSGAVFDMLEEMSSEYITVFRIVRLMFTLTTIAHLCACAWFMVAEIEGHVEASWTTSYGVATVPGQPRRLGTQYLSSVYWAITTLTTVGYGDISAHTDTERTISLVMMLLGTSGLGIMIAKISALAAQLSAKDVAFDHSMEVVSDFLDARRVEKHLRPRTREFFHYIYEGCGIALPLKTEEDVLHTQSVALRRETLLSMYKSLIREVTFLHGASNVFVVFFLERCKTVFAMHDDHVIVQGDIAKSMFVIATGTVRAYKDGNQKCYLALTDGAFFGEIGCILHTRRTTNIVASRNCEMVEITDPDCHEVMKRFPGFGLGIRAVAHSRFKATLLDAVDENIYAAAAKRIQHAIKRKKQAKLAASSRLNTQMAVQLLADVETRPEPVKQIVVKQQTMADRVKEHNDRYAVTQNNSFKNGAMELLDEQETVSVAHHHMSYVNNHEDLLHNKRGTPGKHRRRLSMHLRAGANVVRVAASNASNKRITQDMDRRVSRDVSSSETAADGPASAELAKVKLQLSTIEGGVAEMKRMIETIALAVDIPALAVDIPSLAHLDGR
jgi:hyperpolarization activated cyclic nucleotide-gated potassium channel 2